MVCADIRPIEDWSGSRILCTKTIILGNLLTLFPLLLMLAGLGVAAGVAYMVLGEDLPENGNLALNPIVGGVLIAIGVVIAAASAYWGLRNSTQLGGWYLRRLARREIKSRPEGIVDPDDPQAMFVEVVPREHWQRLMLETATDVGFLLIDEGRREVLFEGDRERMRMSAESIRSCRVEETVIGEGSPGAMKHYFTVIDVRHATGDRELPFAYRGDMGQLGAGVREQRATALAERIHGLRT